MDYDVQCKYRYVLCYILQVNSLCNCKFQKNTLANFGQYWILETLRIALYYKIRFPSIGIFHFHQPQPGLQTLCCGRYSALMFVLRGFSVYSLQYTCGLPHNTNTQYNVSWILWYCSVWLVSKKCPHNIIIIHNPPTMNPLGHVHMYMYAYSTHVQCFQRVSCHWVPVSVRASPRGGRSFWHSQQSRSVRPEHWHWPVQGEETLR